MPNAVTVAPVGHDDVHDCGVNTSDGGRTVKGAEEKSFVDPVAVMVYVPAGMSATSKLPVRMPPYEGYAGFAAIEHVGDGELATADPDIVQVPLSSRENPEPHTCTWGLGTYPDVYTWPDVVLSMSGFSLTLKSKSPTLFVKIALSG